MEPTEISLEDLLQNRTLTVEEARDLASSMVAAIQALHMRGLVHGQIEPANILAAGELVKLRSDCVKEAVDDPDGIGPNIAEQKTADARALAVVLLQALTGKTSLQGSATLLPSPFDGIIRNGLSGRWGLAEMSAALGPVTPKQVAAATARPAAQPAAAAQQATKPVEVTVATVKVEAPATTKSPAATAATPMQESLFAKPKPEAASSGAKPEVPVPAAKLTPAPAYSPKAVAESLAAAAAVEKKPVTPFQAPDVRHRIVKPVEDDSRRARVWVAAAVALILLLVIGWRMMRSEPTASATGAAKPISTLGNPDSGSKSASTPVASTKPSATKLAGGRAAAPRPVATVPAAGPVASAATAGARTQWRVVAYTYNHQDQAQQKADSIAKQHSSLNPEVFSPSGHAPYLVTVGGPMSREQAEVFKQKARGEGLPHDIYAQNYSH
jgi:hypothetical protein